MSSPGWCKPPPPIQLGTVANIDLFEGITIALRDICQGFQIAGIGEFSEIDNRLLGLTDDMAHHSRADKACTTGALKFS